MEKNDRNDELLDEAIERTLESINNLDPVNDSEAYGDAINSLRELYKLQDERKKLEFDQIFKEAEMDLKLDSARNEEAYKEKQRKQDFWTNVLKIGTDVLVGAGSIAAWICFEGTWRKRGMIFEESGTYSSQTTRRIMGEKFPKIWGKK